MTTLTSSNEIVKGSRSFVTKGEFGWSISTPKFSAPIFRLLEAVRTVYPEAYYAAGTLWIKPAQPVSNSLMMEIVGLPAYDLTPNSIDTFTKILQFCKEGLSEALAIRLEEFLQENPECKFNQETQTITTYKTVKPDGYDFYSGSVQYKLNEEVALDNYDPRHHDCGKGLHSSGIVYAAKYAGSRACVMLSLRINLSDILGASKEKVRARRVMVEKVGVEVEGWGYRINAQ